MYLHQLFILLFIFRIVNGVSNDTVQISNSIYVKEKIQEFTEDGYNGVRTFI